jgi:hypothetical protein
MTIVTFGLLLSLTGMAQKKPNKEKESGEKNKTDDGTIHLRIEKYENGQKKVYEHTYKNGELTGSGFSQGYHFDSDDSIATFKLFGGPTGDTSFVVHPSGNLFFNLNDSTFSKNHFQFEHNLDSILHNTYSFMPNLDSLLSSTITANTFMWHDMDKNFQFQFDTLLSKGFDFKWDDNLFDGDNLEMTLDKDKYDIEEVEVDGKMMLKIKPKASRYSNRGKDSKKRPDIVQPFDDLLNLSTKPNTGIVNLHFEVPSEGTTTITVKNAKGKEVYRQKIKNKAGIFSRNIDLSKQGSGVFIVDLEHNGQRTSRKINLR